MREYVFYLAGHIKLNTKQLKKSSTSLCSSKLWAKKFGDLALIVSLLFSEQSFIALEPQEPALPTTSYVQKIQFSDVMSGLYLIIILQYPNYWKTVIVCLFVQAPYKNYGTDF